MTTPDHEARQQFEEADKPLRWYWGLLQLASIIISFISLTQTLVYFNECEKRRLSPWRLLVSVPFYSLTVMYRVTAIALLSIFFRQYVLIPIFLITILNTVSFKLLGLDLPRSLVYGVCSLTAPAGTLQETYTVL